MSKKAHRQIPSIIKETLIIWTALFSTSAQAEQLKALAADLENSLLEMQYENVSIDACQLHYFAGFSEQPSDIAFFGVEFFQDISDLNHPETREITVAPGYTPTYFLLIFPFKPEYEVDFRSVRRFQAGRARELGAETWPFRVPADIGDNASLIEFEFRREVTSYWNLNRRVLFSKLGPTTVPENIYQISHPKKEPLEVFRNALLAYGKVAGCFELGEAK